jgi:hypothetical protein
MCSATRAHPRLIECIFDHQGTEPFTSRGVLNRLHHHHIHSRPSAVCAFSHSVSVLTRWSFFSLATSYCRTVARRGACLKLVVASRSDARRILDEYKCMISGCSNTNNAQTRTRFTLKHPRGELFYDNLYLTRWSFLSLVPSYCRTVARRGACLNLVRASRSVARRILDEYNCMILGCSNTD